MLGHELRNPLAPILTAVQLMKLRDPQAFEKERTIVERQVRHMVTLVDDLLDVSRIARGRIEFSREWLQVSEIVQRALEMAQPLIEERRHQVSVTVVPGLCVYGDLVRLAQVLSNLLTNAAKYTDRGGQITVGAGTEEGQVVLWVRDTGVGIDRELLPKVFDLFVQGRQALDRSRGGLGLGLAIVRSVVELHGGRVTARSGGLGQGSEFRVYLPAPVSNEPRDPAQLAPPPLSASSPTCEILVVDDNRDARNLLIEGLSMMGHRTHSAADAATALMLAKASKPEIALLDIGLPGTDGYELARLLRALPGLDQIKLIAITGYGQPSDKERAKEVGFDEHLVKPIALEHLQAAVQRLLGV